MDSHDNPQKCNGGLRVLCEYFSCIITRDLNVHWLKQNPMNHEAIIESTKLDDKKLQDRDFIRIEINPKGPHITRNQDDWTLKIDDERTLPEWYEKNVAKATKACWKAWTESVKINLLLNDESVTVTDTFLKLHDSSSAELHDSSRAVLYDSSRALLCGSSRAVLHDSSSAELCGSSSAELYDSSRALLCGSSSAELHDSSRAVLHDSSRAVLYDSSRAVLHDSSSAELHDSSRALLCGSSSAELHDSSSAELRGSSRAELKGRLATAIKDDTIYVHPDAKILKQNAVGYPKEA
jgi:hypothetical protein